MRTIRRGFTLVELLVAMALTLFIMAIISQAFVAGLETFSGLKAIGDMQQNLRVAGTVLREDLALDHFEGRRKLSDPQLSPTNRPKEGYFFIRQVTQVDTTQTGKNYEVEGIDADGLPSQRAVNHCLAFAVKMRGNARENVMMSYDIPTFPNPPPVAPQKWSPLSLSSAYYLNQRRDALHNPGGPPNYSPPASPNITWNGDKFASQWAEVSYFLVKTGTTDEPTNPLATTGTPLYGLYRAQYLLVPRVEEANMPDSDPNKSDQIKGTTLDTLVNGPLAVGCYAGISYYDSDPNPGTQLTFNSPATVADTMVPNGTPTGNVTAVSSTNPIVVTCGGNHGLSSGEIVVITDVKGVTFPNGFAAANGSFTVTALSATSFALNGSNGAGASNYVAGSGTWTWGVTKGLLNRVLPLRNTALPANPGTQPRKAALVCPNVVSFQVQTMPLGLTSFGDISAYDTTLVPVPLAGIKCTIRVFDFTTRFSRQLSIIQDL